jgi:hypothetical protein
MPRYMLSSSSFGTSEEWVSCAQPTRAAADVLGWPDLRNKAPHPYSEVVDVWKTSCPRLSVWEDACIGGLVDCHPVRNGTVFLTEKGKCFLDQYPTR